MTFAGQVNMVMKKEVTSREIGLQRTAPKKVLDQGLKPTLQTTQMTAEHGEDDAASKKGIRENNSSKLLRAQKGKMHITEVAYSDQSE